MNLNEYAEKALSFRLPSASPAYALLNLAGETGELFSLLAKAQRDNTEALVVQENVKKELGDILWHVAAVGQDFGFTMETIAATNIEKLQSRSDRGKLQGSGDDR